MQEVTERKQALIGLLNRVAEEHLKPDDAQPIKGIALVWAYEDGAVGYAFNVQSLSFSEMVGIATILQKAMLDKGENC